MMVRYLTHPEVVIDPAIEVPLWGLSPKGKARVAALAQSGALTGTTRVISSGETKAIETATPLAKALGCEVEIRDAMHENDRRATGFLQKDEFEAVADQFFARPDESVRGWETARSAQARICREVDACLKDHVSGDILFVGHGGVGTLLYCALNGYEISRSHDQGGGGGGCYFAFDFADRKPITGWQPLEHLFA